MTVAEIIAAVEYVVDVSPGVVKNTANRSRYVTLARHAAIYIARKKTHLSYARIAKEFGTTDHSLTRRAFKHVSWALLLEDSKVTALMRKLDASGLFGASFL